MPKEPKQFVAVYGRVSDAEDLSSSSVPDQIRDGRAFARKRWPGLPLLNFKEIKSAASIRGRPVFIELLGLVDEGKVKALVVRDQDRLSRETGEMLGLHQMLTKHGVEVWTYRNNHRLRADQPQEKAFLTMMATFSTLEREMAAVRTKSRMNSMRQAGKWTGGRVPKGYRLRKIDGEKRLVPDPKVAPLIVRVFETAAETKCLATAYELSRTLRLWAHKTGLQYALRNRFYVGEYSTPDGWLKNHHKPIIDPTTFALAQQVGGLEWHPHPGRKIIKRRYILAGMLRCGRTRKILTPKHVKKKNGRRIHYYEHSRRPEDGRITRIRADRIEQDVWEFIAGLCAEPAIIQAALEESERSVLTENADAHDEWQRYQEQRRETKTERDRLLSYVRKIIQSGQEPATSINNELLALDEKIERLGVLAIEAKTRAQSPLQLSAGEWVAALRRALSEGPTTPQAREQVIKSIVKEVVIYDEEVEIVLQAGKSAIGSNIEREWLPELDSNQQPSG